ncbi:tryptophan halogenase family protein [Roseateles sp. LYH14W]|uniref:Tryptophan halogenase family protein n=1 Tax=Pelomonas parva TaxID=3299032 RepID=A0ABW7FEZ4_9BURK
MTDPSLKKIVIVGGGTAGWMTAAPLARLFERAAEGGRPEVVLIESPDIGTIGVGEATLPPIRAYNRTLGLDGADFVRKTQGSFKLGIEFRDWGSVGNRFFHGFGDFGPPIDGRSPWQHWLRLQRKVAGLPTYEDWSMSTVMSRRNRFTPPADGPPSAANAYSFAYHFDAGLYAAYLRDYSVQRGTQRVEGTIVDVELRPEDGFVAAVKLKDGRRIEGDLFIDCSGFRALLIEGAMKSPFEDWSALLPCNSALAVPSERLSPPSPLTPYTTSTAKAAGWQWRIPLQHRTGNGHVYCSGFISDDEAAATLLAGLDSKALDTPRQLRFTTGRRKAGWVKNVVAIGLSGGFLEPLESTSIQLIMDGVGRLIQFMPDRHCKPHLVAEFNRLMGQQYESTRDFIALHYKLTDRRDSELWRYCAAMPVSDNLAHQIELFRTTGRVAVLDRDSFQEPSWVSLFMGLGLRPEAYDPFVDHVDEATLVHHFARLRQAIHETAAGMPDHGDYITRHVKALPA